MATLYNVLTRTDAFFIGVDFSLYDANFVPIMARDNSDGKQEGGSSDLVRIQSATRSGHQLVYDAKYILTFPNYTIKILVCQEDINNARSLMRRVRKTHSFIWIGDDVAKVDDRICDQLSNAKFCNDFGEW